MIKAKRLQFFLITSILWMMHSSSAKAQLVLEDSATIFLPDIVSTRNAEVKITFNSTGTKMLWGSIDYFSNKTNLDIFESNQLNGKWTVPKPVPFATDSNEFDPFFAPDDKGIYFFSNRPGGFGGDDLYYISIDSNGQYGQPVNLGATVNSKGDEWAPIIDPENKNLYFASDGHSGFGKHDLFKIPLDRLKTANPENLGATINSKEKDFDAAILNDGTLIFTSTREDPEIAQLYSYNKKYDKIPAKLPEVKINNPESWTFGPSVSKSDPGYFYFSGKLKNKNKGRTDIYRIGYKTGSWK